MSDVAMARSYVGDIGGKGPVQLIIERAYDKLADMFPHIHEPRSRWTERRVRAFWNQEAALVEYREMVELHRAAEAAKGPTSPASTGRGSERVAENSKIEWTDHTLCRGLRVAPKHSFVRKVVTPDAKSDAVSSIKAKLRISSERSNVVGVQVATCVITAMSARESVTTENIVSPPLQFSRVAQPSTLDSFAIDISRSFFTSGRILSRLCANFRPRFDRVLLTDAVGVWSTLRGTGRFTMLPSFEGRSATFGAFGLGDTFALKAARALSVISGAVASEFFNRLPYLALSAGLKTYRPSFSIFVNRNARLLCGYEFCTLGSLSHG